MDKRTGTISEIVRISRWSSLVNKEATAGIDRVTFDGNTNYEVGFYWKGRPTGLGEAGCVSKKLGDCITFLIKKNYRNDRAARKGE